MAWLGKVSLGNFPDLAGAVTKLSESVKNIEKNFDTALGLESNPEAPGEGSGTWESAPDKISHFEPVKSFVGDNGEETIALESSSNVESPEKSSLLEKDVPHAKESAEQASDVVVANASKSEDKVVVQEEVPGFQEPDATLDAGVGEQDDKSEAKAQAESPPSAGGNPKSSSSDVALEQSEDVKLTFSNASHLEEPRISNSDASQTTDDTIAPASDMTPSVNEGPIKQEMQEAEAKELSLEKSLENDNALEDSAQPDLDTRSMDSTSSGPLREQVSNETSEDNFFTLPATAEIHDLPSESSNRVSFSSIQSVEAESETKESESTGGDPPHDGLNAAEPLHYAGKLEKANREMKMMEAALQGAAKQAQAKADEIAKLMNENEQLKSTIENLKKKTTEADNDALREEYHQRVSNLERKVYALTKERDTLRREQNKKSDVAALLKEKDEIINQVMAEGENLSKKQAAQEATIRKLRAQIRELEEEKQRLNSKLQVEETKVESIKRDKAATEKLLQETIEKNQAEMVAQKEFYTNALNAAKEAEALAEARANSEAKVELENRLREAAEREAMLVQTLDELRQTLSRTERQAVFREEMLQRDINDLQQRYQASELRYNELITQVPESTRPLLRQIEAMQETAARKAEAWAGVEKSLDSRLEAAEAKAAASEEKERLINDRLSQSLSRITILETQIACLRTEHAQLNRTLEKERQRASESRQEYLAAMEDVATHKGCAKQLEDEIKELQTKHKQELHDELIHRELLEKELEQVRASVLDLQRNSQHQISVDQAAIIKHSRSYPENGNLSTQKLEGSGSLSSMEESFFLQASLDSSEGSFLDKRAGGETTVSPYFLKSLTPSAFEAALRQKDGELASYMSRLASLESIRDSLAEELVKMTAQCEKLRGEAALLPGIRAELEALRRRHSSALELMGERDEELEELRADIVDLKEMYREQIDLLINKIQLMGSSLS